MSAHIPNHPCRTERPATPPILLKYVLLHQHHLARLDPVEGENKFAPDAEGEDNGAVEAAAENGQLDLELVEA